MNKPVHTYVGGLVVLLPLLVYGSLLSAGFVWDDAQVIVANRNLLSLKSLPTLFVSEDTFLGIMSGCYRPLTYLTFLADRLLWGVNPLPYHLENLLLHGANSLLFFLLLDRGTGNRLIAVAAALLFSLHPVNCETVAFLSGGRNTLLAVFFLLLSLHALHRERFGWYLALYACSLLAKEFAVVLPLWLYVCSDRSTGGRRPSQVLWGSMAVVAAYLVIRGLVVSGGGGIPLDGLADRVRGVPELALRYLFILVWPFSLAVPYGIQLSAMTVTRAVLSLLAIAALAGSLYPLRRERLVIGAAAWLGIFFLPVSNVVPMGHILMADRNAYPLTLAFAVILAWTLQRLLPSRLIFRGGVAIICCIYGVIAVSRSGVWHDDLSLARAMVRDTPDSSIGHLRLGNLLLERGERIEARQHFIRATELKPLATDPFFALALDSWENDDSRGAITILTRADRAFPGDLKILTFLGKLYAAAGDTVNAGYYLDQAGKLGTNIERISAGMARQSTLQGEELQKQGKDRAALLAYRKALLYEPENWRALVGIGSLEGEQGNFEAALSWFRRAEKSDPRNPLVCYNLAQVYEALGDRKTAAGYHARYQALQRGDK